MEETTFYFAQFKVLGTPGPPKFDPNTDPDKRVKKSIMGYIESDDSVSFSDSADWRFGRIQSHDDYVLGQFGKIFGKERTRYDEDRGEFVEEKEPSFEAEYSMFLLHWEKNLLIYHTRDRVRHQEFRRNFAQGYEKSVFGDVEMEVEFIPNKIKVESVVEDFPVESAEFTLKPSNPHSDPDWEALDDHLKKMLAEKLGIDVDSEEGKSLNFDDELLATALEMAKSEYGDYELVYNEDGELKSISSDKDEPVTMKDQEPNTLKSLKNRASGLIGYATSFLE